MNDETGVSTGEEQESQMKSESKKEEKTDVKREGKIDVENDADKDSEGTDEERGISAQRFVAYIIITGIVLFALEELLEYGAGDMINPEKLSDWLSDNMQWAWLFILVFWLIQAVLAPLPAPLLIMATALLYADTTAGVIFAIVLTWVGGMAGAIVCFAISRRFGREWVVKKGYLGKMQNFDGYLEEKGAYVIFLTRLIPILSFDIVSYAAGLTRLRWKSFIVSTGLGMIPTNVIFILFAAKALTGDMTGLIVMSIVGLIMLGIASYLLVWLMNDYEKWKKEREEKTSAGKIPGASQD